MSISVLMSKIIFMKYLLPVRSKLVPKLKNAQSLLKFGTFDILNTFDFNVKNIFYQTFTTC